MSKGYQNVTLRISIGIVENEARLEERHLAGASAARNITNVSIKEIDNEMVKLILETQSHVFRILAENFERGVLDEDDPTE